MEGFRMHGTKKHIAQRQIHYGRDLRTLPKHRFWLTTIVLTGLICGWPLPPTLWAQAKAAREAADAQPVAFPSHRVAIGAPSVDFAGGRCSIRCRRLRAFS